MLITASAGIINCNAGTTTVTVAANGGTPPYVGVGSFTVTAGTYTYTVTDATGATATTTLSVNQPSAIQATVSNGVINTYGGNTSVTVNANGGSGIFSFSIDGGSYQLSNVFNGIIAGNHTITIQDSRGCTLVRSISITQPNNISISTLVGAYSCNTGTAQVTVSATGGTAPYTGTGIFTVAPGTYIYTVTDANGLTSSNTITIIKPEALTATIDQLGIIDLAGGTTSVAVNVTGGTAPYTYSLDGNIPQHSSVFNNVLAGNHFITTTDAGGCSEISNFILTEPPIISRTESPFSISIYPVPSNTDFTLNITGGNSQPVDVTVIDMAGRTVLKFTADATVSKKFGESLSSGAYIAIVSQSNVKKTMKIIKTR